MRRKGAVIAAIAIAIGIALVVALWPRSPASSRATDTGPAAVVPRSGSPAPRAGSSATPGVDVPTFAVDDGPARPRGSDPTWHPPEHTEMEDDALMARAEWLLDADQAMLARDAAYQILARHPDESRMLRVVVLAGCTIGGDGVKEARQYYPQVARADRELVAAECHKHGVELATSNSVDR